MREVLSDRLVKTQLEIKHTDQLKKFESRLERMGPDCQKYEVQAKERAKAALEAYGKAVMHCDEAKVEEKLQKKRLVYEVIKGAYSDPLVKLHLKEREPEGFKKLERSMNTLIKENVHREVGREISQPEKVLQKTLQKHWEIEF